MSPVEKTIDKVMKLLAKAESTTPEEAEVLVAKATDLMIRHEIDEAMLAQAQGAVVDEIVEKRITFKGSYAEGKRDLFFAVGRAQGFKLLQRSGYGSDKSGTWIGFKHDLEQAELLLTSLLIQQTRAAASWAKENPLPTWATAFEKFAAKRSHMIGFASGVQSLLIEQRRKSTVTVEAEREADATVDSTTSVALVLRTKQERVDDWYDERYGNLKAGRARRLSGDGSARSAGHQAGRSADLGSSRLGARKALGR